jgi:hypothetical protein
MPIQFLKNDKGILKNITPESGISQFTGWWNSISAGDFDNDGDVDYIVGNLGLNSLYRADENHPVRAYAKDFDNNGIYDLITSLYLPDQTGQKKEFPSETRDDLLRQINAMRKKFPSYRSFAEADMDQVLSKEDRKGALILEANHFQSCLLRNEGHGKFTLISLPVEAQLSVLNGMVVDDVDGDGNLDLVLNGNDYGTEVATGRYDALNGLLLLGDGHGQFEPKSILQSGIFIPGNGKALVKLRSAKGHCLLAAAQNRGRLKILELKKDLRLLPLQPGDAGALIRFRDGRIQKREIGYGSSFLSASGRFLNLGDGIQSVEIIDNKSNKREIH